MNDQVSEVAVLDPTVEAAKEVNKVDAQPASKPEVVEPKDQEVSFTAV